MTDVTCLELRHACHSSHHSRQPALVRCSRHLRSTRLSQNPQNISDHFDEDKRYNEPSELGDNMLFISEPGLRSRKPEAHKLGKWVTS